MVPHLLLGEECCSAVDHNYLETSDSPATHAVHTGTHTTPTRTKQPASADAVLYTQLTTVCARPQANHNYLERGMKTHLLTAKLDDRAGSGGQIHSRIGITQPAEVFDGGTDLFALLAALSAREEIACVFVDEAQFLSKQQVCSLG